MRILWLILAGGSGCTWVSEAEHQQRLALLDGDGDGYLDASRGGDDCDDSDAAVNPGASELCATPYDDDCDGAVNADDPDSDVRRIFADSDGDGFGDPAVSVVACALDGYVEVAEDCNDGDATVYPGAPEECPGYGPDKDCSDDPRPCSLSADALDVALSGPGVGHRFVASVDHVVESGVGELLYYGSQQLIDGTTIAGATPLSLLDLDVVRPDLSILGDRVAVSLPNEESVQVFFLEDPTDVRSQVIGPPKSSNKGFGVGVAILAGNNAPLIATLGERGGRKIDLVLSSDSDTSVVASGLDSSAERLAAGGTGDGAVIAVIASSSDTPVSVYEADQGEFSFVGRLGVDGGASVGQAVAIADLDGDGQVDWVLGTDDGLIAFRGPIDGDRGMDDAWWTFGGLGRVSSIVIGDLTGDGVPEVVAGAPGGAGSVVVLRGTPSGAAGTDGLIWLTVRGTQDLGALGSGVGITRGRLGGVEQPVLLMGASGEGSIRLMALPDAW